ncbi:MATE family efflux transporter [uncultured Sunxiuqinia sp.]|uniref:lipopolysaccharide biosynthesis protein n=1 Tax=uncultured Sunxiuqinia sp. TaxID=1573825 RepID=UPI0026049EEC|nr:MATE family efflux transporter [uncultured Sunxiuqinia sp.]
MSTNKRIAKNTAFLYMRMLIMMGISFYTTRILLKELGINDYGIYNVVGGVVAMFSSLRGLFASATQRFLNYEVGKSEFGGVTKIFSMSINIHIILSATFLFFAEFIGLWYINNKLVIEPERLFAAQVVFHLSVFSAIITIMTVPYDATIIAKEKMNVYAYISILDGFLKLMVVILLGYLRFDKLILYAILILIVSLITRLLSTIYCKKNFPFCKYQFSWNLKLFKQMGSFAGWNFFGNSAYVLANEGGNILLNLFGGTSINAARGIAYQVRSATTQFITNLITAANPRIVQLYAQKKSDEFFKLIFFTSKASFFVSLALILPVLSSTDFLLNIWLKTVPSYTTIFVQLILVFILIRIFHGPLDSLFKATGKIKTYQLIDASILFLNFPISYLLLSHGFKFYVVFIVMIGMELINLFALLILATKTISLDLKSYLLKVLFPSFKVLVVCFPISMVLTNLSEHSIFVKSIALITCSLIVIIFSLILGLSKFERKKVLEFSSSACRRIMKSHPLSK